MRKYHIEFHVYVGTPAVIIGMDIFASCDDDARYFAQQFNAKVFDDQAHFTWNHIS